MQSNFSILTVPDYTYTDFLDIFTESNDFTPFSSKLEGLLFLMLNSPRPMVLL